MATLHNWDGTQSWTPSTLHRPRDEQEIADLVSRAAQQGHRIKAVGGALSWSDCIDIPDQAIVTDNMSGIVKIDRDTRRITVQGGARLGHVNEVLAQHGLAFENFGSIVIQSAAGYLGTGTHGTGGNVQILSTFVDRLRLVDGRGQILELSSENEPELFKAARVHLGCLGVVTEITFRCVDAFDVEERLELIDYDRALADLDNYVDRNDYCKFWWLPYTNRIQVYTYNKTTAKRTRRTVQELMDSSGFSGLAFSGLLAFTRVVPGAVSSVLSAVQSTSFRPRVRVDRSDKVLRYSGSIPNHQETEYAVPRACAAKAIEAAHRMIREAKRYRVNWPQEVRFVKADDIPMSPTSGRDTCYVGAYVASKVWAKPLYEDFEELIRDFDGRPHWGKSSTRTAVELKGLYPAYEEFDALRRKHDPQGVFRNRFVDRVFPQQ